MGRFEPTGPVDVPGLEHSVVNLSWGVLRGALGPSDGTAGAASNVPSALGVVRHAEIYRAVPDEIEEAFGVLEQHVIKHGQLYPVVLATLPFLFDTLRRGSPVGERIADLIALYAASAKTLEAPLPERVIRMIADQSGDVIRWFGKYDRALSALVIHVPALRELFIAAVEGAERVAPEVLLALVELDVAPGDTPTLALAMLDGADATDNARMCAAAFLARFGEADPQLLTRLAGVLPPSAHGALCNFVNRLWKPKFERPVVAPRLCDAEVLFTGKKLVVVRTGGKSVTLPWVGADVARGDRLKIGLSVHGEPTIAVVTDWRGNVRVIDF